jgi:hypothetical protein
MELSHAEARRGKRPRPFDVVLNANRDRWQLRRLDSLPFDGRSRLLPAFRRFVAAEVMPVIREHLGTRDAARKAMLLAQLLAELLLAELVGKVLAVRRSRSRLMAKVLDALAGTALVRQWIGNEVHGTSRYSPTDRTLAIFERFATWRTILDPLAERPIVLRCNGADVRLPKTTPDVIRTLAARIDALNRANLIRHEWRHPERGDLMTCVRAIYNGGFSRGGRLYSWTAAGYQTLSKAERAAVTIDGQPVAELDFSGFHARALYHLAGIDFQGDVYQPEKIFPAVYRRLAPRDKRLKGFTIDQVRDAARTLAKLSLNILLNAKSDGSARQAIGKLLGLKNTHRNQRRAFQAVVVICRTDVRSFVAVMKTAHAQIAHHFCTGVGAVLQATVDGPMMVDVLETLMAKGVPALSLHDGIICSANEVNTAKSIMAAWYQNRFGFPPVVQVKNGDKGVSPNGN